MPERPHLSRLSVWLWACLSIGCQPEVAEPVVEPALLYSAVVGGKEVNECQFPSTVSVAGGCTGTLIHPRIVTTAAHCLNSNNAPVRFGGARDGGGSFEVMARCVSGARSGGGRGGGGGGNRDWGYCVLPDDERIKKLPFTPPLVGCERERFLKPGASGWVVGYGTTGPEGRGAGVKRAVEVKVNRVSDGIVNIGDRNVGACHGDSGGPIYMQLSDGANDYGLRVFGSTSGAGDAFCDCTCSTNYVDIVQHVKAIEENEDIDVTPCTDAEGKWAPGPECNAIQTQPMMGSGSFPECTVGRTTTPINSCMASAAPAAGSGGSNSMTAAAGSGAKPNATAGAGGSTTSASAAGSSAPAAAGGGATPPVATGTSNTSTPARMTPTTGAAGATGFTSMSASTAGASGSRPGTIATGTSTQGVSAAGGPAQSSAPVGAVAPSPPSPVDSGGCGVATAPKGGETSSAVLCALSMLWLTSRTRRRRS